MKASYYDMHGKWGKMEMKRKKNLNIIGYHEKVVHIFIISKFPQL